MSSKKESLIAIFVESLDFADQLHSDSEFELS